MKETIACMALSGLLPCLAASAVLSLPWEAVEAIGWSLLAVGVAVVAYACVRIS